MVQGEAAESPSKTRLAECVCLRLFKEFGSTANRPTGIRGHKLGLPQSIVQAYSHIQQLVRDSTHIAQHTNLASILLTVNTTTVAKWIKKRQERIIPSTLIQGIPLPESISIDHEQQQPALSIPTSHQTHEHVDLDFTEPDNREGQAFKKQKVTTSLPSTSTSNEHVADYQSSQSWPQYQYGWPGWGNWSYYYQVPSSTASFPAWPQQPPPPPPSAETPSQKKSRSFYRCSQCGKAKSKETNHTQLNGKWFCPASSESFEDWKDRVYKCNTCGLTMSKENGHIRHPKKRREWYCPSSNQTVEEWKRSFDQ